MKNVIFLLLLVNLSTSCKKYYNCDCQTTIHFSSNNQVINSEVKPLKAKYSKKEATAICNREASALDKTYNNVITYNGAYSSNGYYSRSVCTIVE